VRSDWSIHSIYLNYIRSNCN